MGFKELFGGKADGIAFEPTRGGAQPMMKDGKPVLISQLTKEQRRSLGMGTKPASRAVRKQRKEWGR